MRTTSLFSTYSATVFLPNPRATSATALTNTCFSRPIARPEPVLSNPRDESVHGIFDATGGALEWTDDWFDESRDLRHALGGSWAQARLDVLAVGGGQGYEDWVTSGELGFRLAWDPPAADDSDSGKDEDELDG